MEVMAGVHLDRAIPVTDVVLIYCVVYYVAILICAGYVVVYPAFVVYEQVFCIRMDIYFMCTIAYYYPCVLLSIIYSDLLPIATQNSIDLFDLVSIIYCDLLSIAIQVPLPCDL